MEINKAIPTQAIGGVEFQDVISFFVQIMMGKQYANVSPAKGNKRSEHYVEPV